MPVRLNAIRPRKSPAYKLADFERAMEAALEETGKAMIRDFKRTVATWEHKPDFQIMGKVFKVGSRVVSITVGTDDEIYGYVSLGTRPHIIQPRSKPTLLFRQGYRAKTKPGRFLSKPGGAYGDWVAAKEVRHPGNEPRGFEELVRERHEKRGTLEKAIQSRWNKLGAK